jgi:hypothetical protein
VRYQGTLADIRDSGIGSLNLVSRGDHAHSLSQTLQATETAVLGTSVLNQSRFQYARVRSSLVSNDPGAAILVLGAFSGGGSQNGDSAVNQNSYEFQNNTTITHGKQVRRFGARLRGTLESDVTPGNFGGTYTFSGGLAPVLDSNSNPVTDRAGNFIQAHATSIERYRRTVLFDSLGYSSAQMLALGAGPAQFTISGGNPRVSANQFDAGLFANDDWKVRQNLTLSLGFRYETQTNVRDHRDFAPRIGMAWAPGGRHGKSPKTVIRAGFGMFYERFQLTDFLTALRNDGTVQQHYLITNPPFYPAIPSLIAFHPTITVQKISSSLRAPYVMQSALGAERQLSGNTSVSITWAYSHGLHQFRSTDINAPAPNTQNPLLAGSGVLPFPGQGPLFLMESSGLYNQHQLITNINSKVSGNVSLFSYYVYNRALSNTDGLTTFPAHPYDYSGEYGPASTDIRQRFSLGGTIVTKWDIRLSPLFSINSGTPFNITSGSDIYGDTLFTARPGIAMVPGKPGLIATKYGLLDPDPAPGERILPRNSGRGPGSIMFNLRVGRVFAFGPRAEGSIAAGGASNASGGVFGSGQTSSAVSTGRRYNLSISMQVRNLINHTNPGPIIGNIASPLFGWANQSAGASSLGGTNFLESANNRRLELQTRFTF